jgi:hypothetical protein
MPEMTYKPIATTTFAEPSQTVTFSSIPSTYRDLIVVVASDGTAITQSGVPIMRFNSDSATNYREIWMQAALSSFQSGSSTNSTSVQYGTNTFLHSIIQIMDYSVTDKNKVVLSKVTESINNVGLVQMKASRWGSNSAITTISFSTNAGDYPSGTTFSLYGVIA